jgi:osmotically-inducible protein OsmY
MKRLLLLLSIGGWVARRLGPERRAAVMRAVSSRVNDLRAGRSSVVSRPGGGEPLAGSPDDATLAHKVETVLFRPDDVPKGNINVNVEYGKVVLRGEADNQEMIDELVRRATEIEGVTRVESLLHLPGEPAPMHE